MLAAILTCAITLSGCGGASAPQGLTTKRTPPRRAWLFSANVRGAEVSAGLYSIVATAGMNGPHARRFLGWLIGELAQGVPTDEAG
jgi:hypothetical protein